MATTVEKADIPVVILCGGMGTRLREASEKLPKPLVDIGGKPILWHIMKLYGAHGFRRFIRLARVRELLDGGQLDDSLRWRSVPAGIEA